MWLQTVLSITPLNNASVSGILSGVYSKLLHPRKQRRPIETHAGSGSVGAADPSLGFSECTDDLLTLFIGKFIGDTIPAIESTNRLFHDPDNVLLCGSRGRTCWLLISGFAWLWKRHLKRLPRLRMTARSMKFPSSRALPGHSKATCLILVVGRGCRGASNFTTKVQRLAAATTSKAAVKSHMCSHAPGTQTTSKRLIIAWSSCSRL